MQGLVLVIHIFTVICLVILILLQQGKGSDVGAAFGSGASNTMFGSVGSVSFLAKLTASMALIFFITSITLGMLIAREAKQFSLLNSALIQQRDSATSEPKPAKPLDKQSDEVPSQNKA